MDGGAPSILTTQKKWPTNLLTSGLLLSYCLLLNSLCSWATSRCLLNWLASRCFLLRSCFLSSCSCHIHPFFVGSPYWGTEFRHYAFFYLSGYNGPTYSVNLIVIFFFTKVVVCAGLITIPNFSGCLGIVTNHESAATVLAVVQWLTGYRRLPHHSSVERSLRFFYLRKCC